MRSLASSAVSVLLLSLAAVTSSPKAGDQPEVYEDQCDYTGPSYKCGDKCLCHSSQCDCGGTTLAYELVPTHHCCPDAPCTQTESEGDVSCKGGEVLPINTTCHGKCYADISNSKYLDYDKSRYNCQGEKNECLTVSSMCQGLCSAQICNKKTLRCDEIYTPNITNTKIWIASLNKSDVIKEHAYCKVTSLQANSIYDSLDRSDEKIENTLAINDTRIDIDYLTNCTNEAGYPGLTCYKSSNKTGRKRTDCRILEDWCRSDRKDSCIVNAKGQDISTNSKTMCSNNTMWKYVPTGAYDSGELRGYGTRCNGTSQHQINPWYKYYNGEPKTSLKVNCEDYSDRIHTAKAPCPNQTYFLNIHRSLWCSDNLGRDLNIQDICTASWSPPADVLPKLDDPHSCQKSCEVPGPGCIACTNKDYFRCRNSSLCIHPRLRCDGHPQCPENDDEDYRMCNKTYMENGLVAPFATFRCHSRMYPEIETIATRCNNITECDNGTDEMDCSENPNTKYVLVAVVCLSLCIFLGIKLPQIIHFIRISKKIKINIEETEENKQYFDQLIQNLRENPESTIVIQNINTFLLHIQNTKKTSVVKKIYIKFYDSLVELFEFDSAKIIAFLKANIHPAVITDVEEHRFRGLKTKIIEFMEKEVLRCKMITNCTNKVTEKPILRLTLSSLSCLVGLLSHILNTVKDFLLALTLLYVVGVSSITEFPTSFSTAVVVTYMGTILVPILLSSAHLALTSPFLVFYSARLRASRWGRVIAGLGCLLLSPLNAVVLKSRHETKMQEAINAARDLGENTMSLFKECKKIKTKVSYIIQHDIGLQVFYQVSLQLSLLLLTQTKTATVGGLETFFNHDKMFGVPMAPDTFIILSSFWSLKTSTLLHVKLLSLEKGYFGFKAKTAAFLWGLVAGIRRVIGISSFFAPCLGLLNLLWHYHAERFPFQVRLDYAKRLKVTPPLDEKIQLYNMTEEVLWADLDRWNFEDPHNAKAPNYDIYTGLSAKWTLVAFVALFILHSLAILIVKLITSEDYRKGGIQFQKVIHIITNTNIPTMYRDWDFGDLSVDEHRRRYKKTEIEMGCLLLVNTVFSLILLGPLWYTVSQINARHNFLARFIGTQDKENLSYSKATEVNLWVTLMTCVCCMLEIGLYFLYNRKFHPWLGIISGGVAETKEAEDLREKEKKDGMRP